jgi:hypothetical protein
MTRHRKCGLDGLDARFCPYRVSFELHVERSRYVLGRGLRGDPDPSMLPPGRLMGVSVKALFNPSVKKRTRFA